ncbi:NADPH dehydrogenase [Corynebacterium kalinowskii]|uniref:NADPH dehydrogenase n=1 Tax=Corynebacterium kalinowskii TaxID=2675216 RepID=A0A6B8VUF8_9CORY|nr:NADH:flavin oxidoreductase/NADH oxidase [Corynebacterium kalinowskii]QGU03277.1 NADPH dehydrogenase [Corynebacterium kalinowskii]
MNIFAPVTIRDLEIKNRIWLPPMCQYQVTTEDGVPNNWHLTHYGARAVGGFGLIIVEASAVAPEGRISPRDTGLWSAKHILAWHPIVSFAQAQGAKMAVQLAHAGRKASTYPGLPGFSRGTVPPAEGGWETIEPGSMTHAEVLQIPSQFAESARCAVAAGFDAVEIHAAHGYLLHQFLSPLSNTRIDDYGGTFAGRTRLILEVVDAVRDTIPEGMPLIVRVSATDWVDEQASWDVAQTIELTRLLQERGVDVLSVSSGGLVPADIPVAPNYQTDLAAEIRRETGIFTAGVGLITEPAQANGYLEREELDAVLIGRAALRDPHWPWRAAHELGAEFDVAASYARATWS